MDKTTGRSIISETWPLLLCLVLYGGSLAFFPLLHRSLIFPGRSSVVIWPIFWLTPLVATVLLMSTVLSWLWIRKQGSALSDRPFLRIYTPLMLLPPSLLPLFFPSFFPLSLPSNMAVYMPVLALSLVVLRWLDFRENAVRGCPVPGSPAMARPVLLMTVFMSLFFWLAGWMFSVNAGETVGDEGHYIIQAKSLNQDGDLELVNNFSAYDNRRLVMPGGRSKLHISPYSRDGHLYSWHPFGISALMAPFEEFGLGGRHFVLGIVAGLGCGGVLYGCLLTGASLPVAVIFTVLFSFSGFWGVYACRALPETAGGTLTAWLLAALLLFPARPLRALLLGVLCCGLLPWFHTRFGPIAALGGVFFLFLIWRRADVSARRKWRLGALFCGLAAVAAALFFSVQFRLFTGGSPYPIKSTLFSYPPGMWKVVFGWRSITYMLPLFGWLTASVLWVIFNMKQFRVQAVMAVLIFFAVLVTSCSFGGWSGGSSPFGRYLLVVSPLFVPFGALAYGRLSAPTRWLALFLGLIPCVFFFLMLANIELMYRHFADPRGNLALLVPSLSGLSNPFHSLWFGPLFFLVCGVTVWWRPIRTWQGIVPALALLIMATVAHCPENIDRGRKLGFVVRRSNTWLMEQVDLRKAAVRVRLEGDSNYEIEDVFVNRLDFYAQNTIGQLTSKKLPTVSLDNMISQPLIVNNDWQGRALSWATLISPFRYGDPGRRLFCLRGTAIGPARPVLAVAELSPFRGRTALETVLSWSGGQVHCQCFDVTMEAIGKTFILARLVNGEGELRPKQLAWYPVDRRFMLQTGLSSPCRDGLEPQFKEGDEENNRKGVSTDGQ